MMTYRNHAINYLLAIMQSEAIQLHFLIYGLCIPGVTSVMLARRVWQCKIM